MRTRIISGAVGVLILIVVLIFHKTVVLPIAAAFIIAVMLYELLRAVKLEKCIPVLIAAELCGVAMPFIAEITFKYPNLSTILSFGVTLFAAFVIFVTWLRKHKELRYEQIFFALAVMILVPQAMSTIVRIDRAFNDGSAWIAYTGAYFTGVALGKHKLCPEISPKKTIEGFAGGIVTTGLVYAIAFSVHNGFSVGTVVIWFVVGAVCAVIGTVGDLSASMVKRQIGFKDYGKIMPGHGGLMDRFDSVLFVLPTFYTFLIMTPLVYVVPDYIG
mgnify:CR=1 FL=1